VKFNLMTPCKDCPFRSDIHFHLRPERAAEIADSLMNDGSFPCHKTVDYSNKEWDDGDYIPSDAESFCAGALIILAKEGDPNRLPRIAAWAKMYDPDDIDMDAAVYDSFDEFVDAMG